MASAKIATRKIILGYIAWWILWSILETYVLSTIANIYWTDALTGAVNANIILAIAGYGMSNVLRYYQPSLKNGFYLFILSDVLAFICVFVQRYALNWNIFHDEITYLDFFSQTLLLRGIFSWLMITVIGILSWIWFYLQDQQANQQREEDAAKLAREAELSSLRQQLQPHFLFNSLNSISALAGSRPEEARKMIQQLSDFLRGTIKRDNQQMISLGEELKHLQLYLEIEKVRFGHRLNTIIEHDDIGLKMIIPSLLLQPIVENAIKFGLYDTIGAITIRIEAKAENNYLVVFVENPFDAETNPPKGTGFGLSSVQRRLHLLYGRNDLLATQKKENIFTTLLKIPQSV